MNENAYSLDELIHLLTFSPKRRVLLFRSVPVNKQGVLLLRLSSRVRSAILEKFGTREVVQLLHYVDFDKATKILRGLHARRRERIIKGLKEDVQEKTRLLLSFRPDSAAGLMDLNYITVDVANSAREALCQVETHERKTGKPPTILVLKDGFFVGELPLHELALRSGVEEIGGLARKVPSIHYDKSEREVLSLFREHPRSKIVVLDDDKSVLGVIYSQEILELIQERTGESLYGLAGVRKEENVFDSVSSKVRNRYGWLLLNLATVSLAALVVGLFEETISHTVLLAAYMPVVAGMGGNAGMQTLAVVIRGLAHGELKMRAGLLVFGREILAGATNGLITGAVVAILALLLGQGLLLGVIVAVSIVVNLIVGSAFGTIAPLCMVRLGKDPASSASIFITTATDVLGFLVFLGLARIFLG